MSEKQISARTQQKIDLTANWEKATNFVPKKGEIIVYSDGGGTGIPKMKVGDGATKVGSLKFADEGQYLPLAGGKLTGPLSRGAITMNSQSGGGSGYGYDSLIFYQTSAGATTSNAKVAFQYRIPTGTSSGTMRVVAPEFEGKLIGNADTATSASKVNGHTVNSDVPADAKFTDTIYSLPVASSSTLGGVKIGSGLTVAEDGTISAAAAYTLPTASSTTKGGIKVGTGLTMSSETLNHSNSITAKTAYGSTATTASANGGKIVVTDVKYDAQGHITGSTDRTITLSQITYTLAGLMGSTAKGSATQPVYWNGTAWTNTTYTLGKSVPADAKFTDTVYSLPTASSTLGGVKTTSTVSATTGLTACPIIDGVVYYKDTNNTYTLAGLVGSTAIGTATNPIYWDGSKFVKTIYTLGKSVPSDAKFTDTVYSLPTASSTLGGVKTTSTVTSTSGLTACPIIEGVPYYKNNTYTLAGLMGSTAKGSATQPVYWNGTAWTNTTHTLGASVPANAKFTDTVYTLPTASSSVLGGIKLGTGLTAASDGTVNVSVGGATITLKTWTDADVA